MSQCSSCDNLRGQVSQLTSQVNHLNQVVANLSRRLGNALSGVNSTAVWIVQQIKKPTMKRGDMLPYLVERLNDVIRSAQ